MTRPAQHEYAAALRARYRAARQSERGQLLDEFCHTTGCHRKAAIRLLRRAPVQRTGRRGRPRRYGPELVPVLSRLWELTDRPCAKLLAPVLPALLDALGRHGELPLPPAVHARVRTLSAATLDRLLGPVRRRLGRQPRRPYQRLLVSGVLPAAQRDALAREFRALNPVTLARQIDDTLDALWKLRESPEASKQAQRGEHLF